MSGFQTHETFMGSFKKRVREIIKLNFKRQCKQATISLIILLNLSEQN